MLGIMRGRWLCGPNDASCHLAMVCVCVCVFIYLFTTTYVIYYSVIHMNANTGGGECGLWPNSIRVITNQIM